MKSKIRSIKPAVLPEFENLAKIIMEEEHINFPSNIKDALKLYIKEILSPYTRSVKPGTSEKSMPLYLRV